MSKKYSELPMPAPKTNQEEDSLVQGDEFDTNEKGQITADDVKKVYQNTSDQAFADSPVRKFIFENITNPSPEEFERLAREYNGQKAAAKLLAPPAGVK